MSRTIVVRELEYLKGNALLVSGVIRGFNAIGFHGVPLNLLSFNKVRSVGSLFPLDTSYHILISCENALDFRVDRR
jgi:hypothetical protein